jgi:hypothetical protein
MDDGKLTFPAPDARSKYARRRSRAAVNDQQYGIRFVVPADSNPRLDATGPYKTLLINSTERADLHGGGSAPLAQLPSRGPKPSLSVHQIARVGIAAADRHGLAAVSMQRIAREVGVTTMALYRYFASKDELIDLMIDKRREPVPQFDSVLEEWRAKLEDWTRRCSSVYRDHSWFLQATARRRIMGTQRTQVGLDAALMGSGAFHRNQQDGLKFGLACILDGIECRARKNIKSV